MESEVKLEEMFPKNLGFGTLDQSQIRVEGSEREKVHHAVYLAGPGDPAYKVQIGPGGCVLEEFFENGLLGRSRAADLKQAWVQNFTTFGENPRFKALVNRIREGKNVTFLNPEDADSHLVFFPAGLIFHLLLPIWDIDRMEGVKDADELKEPMHFRALHEGTVLTMNNDRDLIHCPLSIAEFTAPLSDLERAVNFCHERGWIPKPSFPEIGLHIAEAGNLQPGGFWFYGRPDNKRIIGHSLLLNREGDISLTRAEDFARESVARHAPPQPLEDRKKERDVIDFTIGENNMGTIVGFEKKRGGVFCVTCHREIFGNIIHLGDTEQIFDEKQEKDFRRGTSGFRVGEDEALLCSQCWRVVLRIPKFVPAAIPTGN